MNQKSKMSFGVGLPSIIVIFVALCLTTLAALSLMTATADNNLAEKSAAYSKDYYSALGNAQEWLFQVDQALQSGEQPPEVTKNFPVTDKQALSVRIVVQGNRLEVVSQKLIITEPWNYDEYTEQYGDIIVE